MTSFLVRATLAEYDYSSKQKSTSFHWVRPLFAALLRVILNSGDGLLLPPLGCDGPGIALGWPLCAAALLRVNTRGRSSDGLLLLRAPKIHLGRDGPGVGSLAGDLPRWLSFR